MPTLRALECLIAVLDAGSVTEAASRLHMSQPALSHQLAALEREIGTPVVERLPRGVRPTAAGRAVAGHARAAIAASERVIDTGRSVAGGEVGHLRVACAETMTASLLPPVLRVWRRRRPDVRLTLTELTSADLLAEAVETDEADIAVGPRPSRWTGHDTVIGTEEIVVAMAADHPLATSSPGVTFEQLADEPTVHYHQDNGLGSWIDAMAAQHRVTLTATMRTRHAVTAAQLAAAGLGIALVPTTALGGSMPGAFRRLVPALTRDVVALIGGPSDILAQRFVADLRHRGIPVSAELTRKLS